MIVSGAAPARVDALRRVRRCTLHVPTRLLPFLPCALASAEDSVLSIVAPSVNVLARKLSTVRGTAPDVVIGQSYGGSRGSASLRARRSGSVLSLRQRVPTIQLLVRQSSLN